MRMGARIPPNRAATDPIPTPFDLDEILSNNEQQYIPPKGQSLWVINNTKNVCLPYDSRVQFCCEIVNDCIRTRYSEFSNECENSS